MFINYAYNVESCEYIMKNTFNSPEAVKKYLEDNEAEDSWIVAAVNVADQAARQYNAAVSIHNNQLSLHHAMQEAESDAVTTMETVATDTDSPVAVVHSGLSPAMRTHHENEIETKSALVVELEAKLVAYDELEQTTEDSTALATISTNKMRVDIAIKGLNDRINYVKAQILTTPEEIAEENARTAELTGNGVVLGELSTTGTIAGVEVTYDGDISITDAAVVSLEPDAAAPIVNQFDAGAVGNTNQPDPAAAVKDGQNEQSLRDDIAVLKCPRPDEKLADKIARQKSLKVKEEALATLIA